MFSHGHKNYGVCGWNGLLVVAIIMSLTVSLATRFTAPAPAHATCAKSVNSSSTDPKRQHCNVDAMRWVIPIANASFFKPVTVDSHVPALEPLIPDPLFAQALYNRPPPSSPLFS